VPPTAAVWHLGLAGYDGPRLERERLR